MAITKYVRRDAKTLKAALAGAEAARSVHKRPPDGMVNLKPSQIRVRPELFQPRNFVHGHGTIDTEWVASLAKRIGAVGELDPPVVIKLGKDWVCVDGHHRVEAYKRAAARWSNKPIRCTWFGGTVREAVDEAMRGNSKDRLNVTQKDRMEQAWKRVLLDDKSKAEIAKLCGVGERSVAYMRSVVTAYSDTSDGAARLLRDRFRKNLGVPLEEASWGIARMAFHGVESKERDAEQRAETLAKTINSRLTNLLKRDPEVTARALALYDPELPAKLMAAWGKPRDARLNGYDIDETSEDPEPLAYAQAPDGDFEGL